MTYKEKIKELYPYFKKQQKTILSAAVNQTNAAKFLARKYSEAYLKKEIQLFKNTGANRYDIYCNLLDMFEKEEKDES